MEQESKCAELYIREQRSIDATQLVCHSLISSISDQGGTKSACLGLSVVMDVLRHQILIRIVSTHGGLCLASRPVLSAICVQWLNGGQGVRGSSAVEM